MNKFHKAAIYLDGKHLADFETLKIRTFQSGAIRVEGKLKRKRLSMAGVASSPKVAGPRTKVAKKHQPESVGALKAGSR